MSAKEVATLVVRRAVTPCTIVVALLAACSKPVPVVQNVTQVTTDGCKLIEDITGNGVVKTICATIEEIEVIANFILTLRAAIDGGAIAASSTCTKLNDKVCATNTEISIGIDFIVTRRRAVFTRDGGQP